MATTISPVQGSIGTKSDRTNLLTYALTSDTGMTTITEKVNDVVVGTKTATSGQSVAVALTQTQWDAIRFGKYKGYPLTRKENFEGKISGSVVENPHLYKRASTATLGSPSTITYVPPQSNHDAITSLNNIRDVESSLTNGAIAQQLFSFNLIEAVERNIGRIPRSTVADKVQWLKDNVNRLTTNWHGFGSSVGGNKATLKLWRTSDSTWVGGTGGFTHTNPTVTALGGTTDIYATMSNQVDVNGQVHLLAYAEPSNGTIASTINTDYIELDIELKPTALLISFENKITIEMGTDKFTYTFDKRLPTDADLLSAVKAVKDANEVFLPSVKSELATNLTAKGQTSVGTETLDALVDKVALVNTGTRKLTGKVTATASGVITVTGLTFTPTSIIVYSDDKAAIAVYEAGYDGKIFIVENSATGVGVTAIVNSTSFSFTRTTIAWNNKVCTWKVFE